MRGSGLIPAVAEETDQSRRAARVGFLSTVSQQSSRGNQRELTELQEPKEDDGGHACSNDAQPAERGVDLELCESFQDSRVVHEESEYVREGEASRCRPRNEGEPEKRREAGLRTSRSASAPEGFVSNALVRTRSSVVKLS